MLWYRNDLRVDDHEALHCAASEGAHILPVYIDSPTPQRHALPGNPEIPGFRRKFRLESLLELDQRWREWNGSLIVATGEPADVIPQLCVKYKINEVFLNAESSHDESRQLHQLTRNLNGTPTSCRFFHGAPMIHPDDLSFELQDLPDIFTQYRKLVEARMFVRACFATPTAVQALPHDQAPFEPRLPETIADARSALPFHGGESAGKKNLTTISGKQTHCACTSRLVMDSSEPTIHPSSARGWQTDVFPRDTFFMKCADTRPSASPTTAPIG